MTGKTLATVRNDLKRDFYLSSDEAVLYGLIDQVLIPQYGKRAQEIEWKTVRGQRYMVREKEADLGNFEGEEQRYQDQTGGGFGRGWDKSKTSNDDDDDDDGPQLEK